MFSSFYGRNSPVSVFDSGRSNPIATKEAVMILKSDIKFSSIYNKTSVYIKNNVSFIVNTEKLSHKKDIKTDMISGFIGSGTKTSRRIYVNCFNRLRFPAEVTNSCKKRRI